MSRTLAIGLSGQVGEALQALLPADFGPVLALSRREQSARTGVEWRSGTLDTLEQAPPGCERILSLGPLDAFAAWALRARPQVSRIVALGSTGRVDKRDSPDPRDRDEAQRLAQAEQALFEFAARSGARLSVLRPTLLYGGAQDRSLSRLAAHARRWRLLPWPATATGLRQPVHVEDVARAVLLSLDADESGGAAFDLPGAERLPFDAMVERTLAARVPGARLLRLPEAAFRAGIGLAAWSGRGAGARGWLWRAARDQLADAGPARQAFGYAARGFLP